MIAIRVFGKAQRLRTPAAAVCVTLLLTACASRSRPAIPNEDIAARIDTLARAQLATGLVSLSIVVSRRDDVLFQRAYGVADLATQRPVTVDSVYRFPNLQFTAALVLKQVERGKLALSDSIGRHLTAGLRPEWRSITIEQLLSHTSGLPSSFKWDTPVEQPASTETMLGWAARDKTMRFAPGTSFTYSRVGYLLLAALVERMYGKPYYEAVREEIAVPLGLATLGACGESESNTLATTGYRYDSPKDRRPVPNVHASRTIGAGWLCTSAGDLASWTRALHGGRVLSPTSYTAFTNSIKVAERPAIAECCLMVIQTPTRGVLFLTIDGEDGFAAETGWFSASSLSVTVLYNSFRGRMERPFAQDVADALSKPVPPSGVK